MANNARQDIFSGMLWALTDFGRGEILRLTTDGMSLDLAFAVLDEQCRAGLYKEAEIYQLPSKTEAIK